MLTAQMDGARAEAFATRMVDYLNGGAMSLMLSIGHRTGLLDALGDIPSATSKELAEVAGLNERYVREWLGAMLAGGVVEYDPVTTTYKLPAEHAAFLTRKATPDNMAVFAQYISVLGTVEDRIVDCFKNGGGVAYEEYKRFHEVMAEDSGQTVLPALLEQILPLSPGLVDRLETGCDVLDIGCGSGRAANLMAKTFPNSRFFGYDISSEAIEKARAEAEQQRIPNVSFEVKDLTHFEMNGRQFDLVTAFDAIHDQARPDIVLQGIHEVLKPDGVFLMQDIAASSHHHLNTEHPIGALLYTVSCMHCMSVSLAQGGMGLGAMWGEEQAAEMLRAAGFTDIKVHKLPHDFQNNFYVIRKN